MALASAAAIAAGTAAASMYLDATYHIRKDLKGVSDRSKSSKAFLKSVKTRGLSLWPLFTDQVARMPNEECLWSRSGSYSWKETEIRSLQFAQFVASRGLKPGDMFAVYLQNSPEFMFAMLGGWANGCMSALLNYNLAAESLIHCAKISKAKLLFVDENSGCVERIEAIRDVLEKELSLEIVILDQATKDQIYRLQPFQAGPECWAAKTEKSPMCLIFTSGSTGLPKACGSHIINAWAVGEYRVRSLGLKTGPTGDRWYNCMPLYHGTGCSTALSCMLTGMSLCIGTKFSVSRFWDDIRDSRATAFVYVGETARYLLNAPPKENDLQHRVRMMYGNGLRRDVWAAFAKRFGIEWVVEIFNSTEGLFTLSNPSRGPYLMGAVGHQGAIARFMMRNTYVPVEIDYDTGDIYRDPKNGFAKRKPYDEGGEIIVKIPDENAFVGYWENEEATQKKFERNVFKKGDLYYRTGDALRRTGDGRWYFLDRLGDTFRWKSENVATAEVAEVVGQFPGIVEANVYGVEVPGHEGRAGCAAIFIKPEARAHFDFDALQKHCDAKLPKYAVPIFLRILNEITPMHNNKQNKLPLKKDGININAIEEIAKAAGKEPDKVLWRPAALGSLRNPTKITQFVEFTADDKLALDQSVAKL